MPLLGCIAGRFASATEVANALARGGMAATQVIGLPDGPLPESGAVVVAPLSRAASARQAVAESLAACEALILAGCRQILLHMDTPESGDWTGPVADALVRRLEVGFAPICPATPSAGRTVYQGHLFQGAALAGGGGEANLPRSLGAEMDGTLALIPFVVVEEGATAIRRAMTGLKEGGRRYAVLDALTDAHLRAIAEAASGQALVIGSAGLARGLSANVRTDGPLRPDEEATPPRAGRAAVLSGSLSRTTLAQIGFARDRMHTLELDLPGNPDAAALTARALAWADGLLEEGPLLIATSTTPDRAAALRDRLGPDGARELVRTTLAGIAVGLAAREVGRLLVAGGEAMEAVTAVLGLRSLRIGPEIDPGVPWTLAEPGGLHLALKPGAAGARDVFLKAFEV